MILWQLKRENMVMLSLYMPKHIKHIGDYVIDLQNIRQLIEENIPV